MPVLAALRKYLLHYLEKGRSAEMKERKKLSRLKNLLEEAGGYDFTVFETHAESAVVRKKSGGHTERLYETLKKILEECSYRISFALLSEKLRDAQNDFRFDDSELYSVEDAVSLLSLEALYHSPSEELLGNIAYTLRSIDSGDFEDFIRDVSHTDAILRKINKTYELSDDRTRSMYRRKIAEIAKKENISQAKAAEQYGRQIDLAEGASGGRKALFFLLCLAVPVLISIIIFFVLVSVGQENAVHAAHTEENFLSKISVDGAWVYIMSALVSLFVCIPVSEAMRQISDRFFSGTSQIKTVPSLKLKQIPNDAKTIVIITTLLFGEKGDRKIFDALERYSLGNRGKNICFGILGDLPDAKEMITSKDAESIAYAEDRIEALNKHYGGGFCLFIRRRSPTSDGSFMGWERKRGAVVELSSLISGQPTTFETVICDDAFLHDIKYIITLDADTRLPLGGALKLVSCMLHPANRPIIRGGKVVGGHAILQPAVATTADSAACTPFSVMCTGAGGTDVYAGAAYDTYQTLFDRGSFCGKGIIDAGVFSQLMKDRFPEETVLSHDLLEGEYLRSGIISSVTFSDSTPKNKVSYNKRLHRWIRGDVQALAFAEKPLDALSVFKLYDNVRRASVPAFAVLSILFSVFLGEKSVLITTICALAYILLPFVSSLAGFASEIPRRLIHNSFTLRHVSKISAPIASSLRTALYEISSLLDRAILFADAALKSFIRMKFTHRKLLEWTTAAEGDMYKGLLSDYTVRMLPDIFAGAVLMLMPYAVLRIIGLAFFCLPFWSWRLGKPYKKHENRIGRKSEERIRRDVSAMWRFFADNVTEEESYLPPDNVEFSPELKTAHRTSPTNIGLYMASVLCARDFGLISSAELYSRLSDTVSSVNSLAKWHGHLYNWYDTRRGEVLLPYVSTVDSGNFVAALISLRRGIEDYFYEESRLSELIAPLDSLISEADFSVLYSESRGLFYTGLNTMTEETDNGFYDFLMSECRTTSYIAVARGEVSAEHWSKLGRPLVTRHGMLGVLSWSGTAFEYFMPTLFIEPAQNTLEWEALSFALRMQKEHPCRRVFGRSEGCYFAFDSDSNYCYRAFGAPSLAVSREGGENVITPYSSYLMMQFAPGQALANLERIESFGMFGKYGFYESLDFTRARVGGGYAVIKSFMSHHIGMSMLASANLCFDGIFRRRFMRDPEMASAESLLDERIPIGAIVTKKRIKASRPKMKPEWRGGKYQTEKAPGLPAAEMISGSAMHLLALSDGTSMLSLGRIALTAEIGDDFSVCGMTACSSFREQNEAEETEDSKNGFRIADMLHSETNFRANGLQSSSRGMRLLINTDGSVISTDDMEMRRSGEKIIYSYSGESFRFSSEWSFDSFENALVIEFDAHGAFFEISPVLYAEPIISALEDYRSHPAYSAMSIETEYISGEGILIFRKRARKRERGIFVAMAFGSDGDAEFAVRRREILPAMYNLSDIKEVCSGELPCRDGACVDPVAVLRRKSRSKKGIYKGEIYICSGQERDDAVRIIRLLRARKNRSVIKNSVYYVAQKNGQLPMPFTDMSPREDKVCSQLLSRLYFRTEDGFRPGAELRQEDIWKYGISGDLPVIYISLDEKDDGRQLSETAEKAENSVRTLMKCAKKLFLSGIRADFVFAFNPTRGYREPVKDYLFRTAALVRTDFLIGKKGGIHIAGLRGDKNAEELLQCISRAYISIKKNTPLAELSEQIVSPLYRRPAVKYRVMRAVQSKSSESSDSLCSSFLPGGVYRIIKNERHQLPYSYISQGSCFGTLVTQNSLGFSWIFNSREYRITPWSGDAVAGLGGEILTAVYGDSEFDLCAVAKEVQYRGRIAEYSGKKDDYEYRLRVGTDPKLPVKLIHVESDMSLPLHLSVSVCAPAGTVRVIHSGETCFCICLYGALRGKTVFIKSVGYNSFVLGVMPTVSGLDLSEKNHDDVIKSLCSTKLFRAVTHKFSSGREISAALSDSDSVTVTGFYLDTQYKSMCELFNHFLPWQVYACRIRGRTGFYQPGGAYGFRDQLQDCLAAVYFSRGLIRTHIIRCAARQYKEGDVMHWWHDIREADGSFRPRGIRTRCSDDMLWLPFATAYYLVRTGDYEILDVRVPYLTSEPLGAFENDRYESPGYTLEKAPLYEHCIKAFSRIKLSKRGLPFIGSCDWNDGLSAVGEARGIAGAGEGESVWLAIFARLVIRDFLPVCIYSGDTETVSELKKLDETMKNAIEKYAWHSEGDGGFYVRAFYGDGTPIGAGDTENCFIDLIPQAFSAMLGDKSSSARTEMAVEAMLRYLHDGNLGVTKLLAPPFSDISEAKSRKDPGYIKGYPEGMRENGGQYTHAAVWAAWALYDTGSPDAAFKLLREIDPSSHPADIYKAEPYALAGDVSVNESHCGEAGWSLYTGAAAWYYRLILEKFIGYDERGGCFSISPGITKLTGGFKLTVKRMDTTYKISARPADRTAWILDGQEVPNLFRYDKKEHVLEISVKT